MGLSPITLNMQWIPRQYRSYILSNIYLWMGRLALTIASLYCFIGGTSMFTNVPEIYTVIAMCAVAVLGWVGLVQYSRYVQHIKDNLNASETKQKQAKEFAFIPYLVVPVIFASVAVLGGLWVADYTAVHGYLHGTEEIAVVAMVATVVIDCVLQKYLVNHIGDAVYFTTIENRVAEAVEEFPALTEEDREILKVLRMLKK